MVDGYWECMFCGKYIGMEKIPHADIEVRRKDGSGFTGFVCEKCFNKKMGYGEDLPVVVTPMDTSPL